MSEALTCKWWGAKLASWAAMYWAFILQATQWRRVHAQLKEGSRKHACTALCGVASGTMAGTAAVREAWGWGKCSGWRKGHGWQGNAAAQR